MMKKHKMFRGDPFYNLCYDEKDNYDVLISRYEEAISVLSKYDGDNETYAKKLFEILKGKVTLYRDLRKFYIA